MKKIILVLLIWLLIFSIGSEYLQFREFQALKKSLNQNSENIKTQISEKAEKKDIEQLRQDLEALKLLNKEIIKSLAGKLEKEDLNPVLTKLQTINDQIISESELGEKLVINLQSLKEELQAAYADIVSRLDKKLEIEDLAHLKTSLEAIDAQLANLGGLDALRDGGYDESSMLASSAELSQIKESVVILEFYFVMQDFSVKTRSGIGLVIGDYILTINHLADYEPGENENIIAKTVELENQNLKIVFQDPAYDIILFKVPEGMVLSPLAIPIGNSDELEIGDHLDLIGFFEKITITRDGIVGALKGTENIEKFLKNKYPNLGREDVFIISQGIALGDSGGAVLAPRDGQYELVGILQGRIRDSGVNFGWVIRINTIAEHIKKTAGIDLGALTNQKSP